MHPFPMIRELHLPPHCLQEKTNHEANKGKQAQKYRDLESLLHQAKEESSELMRREKQYEKKIKEQAEKLQASSKNLMRLEVVSTHHVRNSHHAFHSTVSFHRQARRSSWRPNVILTSLTR